ncbi:MAG: hypothetical protein LBS89_08605 [Zoogloeaceae bacterium]|jgi:hypothetical protein|nr:hypothetical protein [Zoogloeaceae bacterium]
MGWFFEIWAASFAEGQQRWLEMARLWGLPTQTGGAGESGAFFSRAGFPFSGGQHGLPNLFSAPWLPRVEAQIEPLTGVTEAARLSMRIFMPWGGAPFWVEALIGRQEPAGDALPTRGGQRLLDQE